MTPPPRQIFRNLFPAPLQPIITNILGTDRFAASMVQLLEDVPESQAATILHQKEFTKWQGYRFPKRRNEYLTGRLAAKIALGELHLRTASPPSLYPEICIANHEGGQPYISTPEIVSDLEISISHSGSFGAALAAPVACGIDIQENEDKLVNLQSHFSFPPEVVMLQKLHPQNALVDLLNHLWTAREAIRKAMSQTGMPGFLAMRLADAQPLLANVSRLRFEIERSSGHQEINTYTMLLEGSPNYVLAVTFSGDSNHA